MVDSLPFPTTSDEVYVLVRVDTVNYSDVIAVFSSVGKAVEELNFAISEIRQGFGGVYDIRITAYEETSGDCYSEDLYYKLIPVKFDSVPMWFIDEVVR